MTRIQLEQLAPVVVGVILAGLVLASVCLCSLVLRGTLHPWRRIVVPEPEPEPEPTWISASGVEHRFCDGLAVPVDGSSSSSAGSGWPAVLPTMADTEKETEKRAQNSA